MICQKYIARCYRVYQHERNENASFLSIFNGGGRPKWRFSNFPRFWKNSSALGSFNCIFENNSLKTLLGQNMKKFKILKLSPDSRYLQKLALKSQIMYSKETMLLQWNNKAPRELYCLIPLVLLWWHYLPVIFKERHSTSCALTVYTMWLVLTFFSGLCVAHSRRFIHWRTATGCPSSFNSRIPWHLQ